jgi:hypothetical protein
MSSARPSVPTVALVLSLTLLACPAVAAGQTGNVPAEFGIAPIPDVAQLTCDFRYPERALEDTVQGHELELRLTIQSERTKPHYELTGVSQVRDPGDPNPELVRLVGAPIGTDVADDYRHVRRFDFKLKIDEQTPPRSYDLALSLEAPGAPPVRRLIRLFIGARESQKYVDASPAPGEIPVITAGMPSQISLQIANRFPTYVLTLRQIKVVSKPPDLIEELSEAQEKLETRVGSGDPTIINLSITGKRALLRQLSPFETKPQLQVSLWYDDGYRTKIERVPPIPIEFSLGYDIGRTLLIAIVCVLIGATIGAWIRITFTRVPPIERKVATRNRILASVVFAGVFAIVATIAKVEVQAADGFFKIPLHKPVVTLMIAFAVGLYDPSGLIKYMRARAGLESPKEKAGVG